MMTPMFADPFARDYQNCPVNDLIVFTNHAAEKGASHVAFQGPLAPYVTVPPKLKELSDALGLARDAAAGHDENRVAEQKALMEEIVTALDLNSIHVVLFARHRKDPNIMLNAGYEVKQPKGSKGKVNLLDLIPGLTVKHLTGVTGALLIALKRAKNPANVELQMTETPEDEASWKRVSEGTYNQSRFELRGFEPTKRLHFRARYHEGGSVGAWCAPVSIIVL